MTRACLTLMLFGLVNVTFAHSAPAQNTLRISKTAEVTFRQNPRSQMLTVKATESVGGAEIGIMCIENTDLIVTLRENIPIQTPRLLVYRFDLGKSDTLRLPQEPPKRVYGNGQVAMIFYEPSRGVHIPEQTTRRFLRRVEESRRLDTRIIGPHGSRNSSFDLEGVGMIVERMPCVDNPAVPVQASLEKKQYFSYLEVQRVALPADSSAAIRLLSSTPLTELSSRRLSDLGTSVFAFVSAAGAVDSVQVFGPDQVQIATMVRKLRFRPAMKNDRAVPMVMRFSIRRDRED